MDEPQPAAFRGLRFRGGRYELPGYPIDTVAELVRYERLVFDVARSLWMRRNADRRRLPAGFKDSMQLRIVDVERGSVVPVLERSQTTSRAVTDDDVGAAFIEATRLIERTFSAV